MNLRQGFLRVMPFSSFLAVFGRLSMGCLCLYLGGCATSDDDKFEEKPAITLFNEGSALLKNKRYEQAAKAFDEVERQHPYSEWATQAQLMAAYAHYQNQKYEKTLTTLDSFIALHPAHPEIAYAYYLQGLCYYEQLSPVERDQKVTEFAYESFEEVINRFPNSDYAKDARYKLVLLRDLRAGKEMDVGRYYQDRKSHVGAMNRFRTVVDQYQTTVHVPEALHRLVEVYLALGLKEEASATAAVLGHNYPDSAWYAETYFLMKGQDFRSEKDRPGESWIHQIWKTRPKV